MKDKKVTKFMSLYMSLGMCFGVSLGLCFGSVFSPNHIAIGMTYGIPIGMCLGMALGAAKDKKLSEKMMVITQINSMDNDSAIIKAVDKDNIEHELKVTAKQFKAQKFKVGNRVAFETENNLISLEG